MKRDRTKTVLLRVSDLLDRASRMSPDAALTIVTGAAQLCEHLRPRDDRGRMSHQISWGTVLAFQARLRPGAAGDRLRAEAVEKFLHVLELEPHHPEALSALAVLRLEQAGQEEGDTGLDLCTRGLEFASRYHLLFGGNDQTLAVWGRLWSRKAELESPEGRFVAMTEAAKKFHGAHRRQAKEVAHLLEWGVSLSKLARVAEDAHRDGLLAAADRAFERANLLEEHQELVQREWAGALVDRALCSADRQQAQLLLNRACDRYGKAVELEGDEENAETHREWGVALSHRSTLEDESEALKTLGLAREHLARSRKLDPLLEDLAFDQGTVLQRLGELQTGDLAEEAFRTSAAAFAEVTHRNPMDEEAHTERAASLIYWLRWTKGPRATRLIEESSDALDRGNKIGGSSARRHYLRGELYMENAFRDSLQARFLLREAMDEYEAASELAPGDGGVWLSWGRATSYLADHLRGDLAEERFAEADRLLARAAELMPDRHDVHFHRAESLRLWAHKADDPKTTIERLIQAAGHCRSALKLQPNDETYKTELAYIEEFIAEHRS